MREAQTSLLKLARLQREWLGGTSCWLADQQQHQLTLSQHPPACLPTFPPRSLLEGDDLDGRTEVQDPLLDETDDESEDASIHSESGNLSLSKLLQNHMRFLGKIVHQVRIGVDQRSFSLLRKVCMQRFEAHAMDNSVLSFSYVNIASQVRQLEQQHAHSRLKAMLRAGLAH
jgi:hypothetical protein